MSSAAEPELSPGSILTMELLGWSGLFGQRQLEDLRIWWQENGEPGQSLPDFLAQIGFVATDFPRTVDCIQKGYLTPENPGALVAPADFSVLPDHLQQGATATRSTPAQASEAQAAEARSSKAETRPRRKLKESGALDALRSLRARMGNAPSIHPSSNNPSRETL